MNAKIIAACEAFSMGDPAPAQAFLAENIEWHIVGDRTIDGHAAVQEMCASVLCHPHSRFTIRGKVI